MKLLFWTSLATVLYVYGGYPLLLVVVARLRPRHVAATSAASLPSISIVVSARNEASRLAARIDNLLGCTYPDHLRQVVVVSDGSTDDTRDVLDRYAGRVDAVLLPAVGKAAALNRGVALARHDILIFADARQTFAPDALLALVHPFSDAGVGGVTGELVLDAERGERRARERRQQLRAGARERRTLVQSAAADGMGLYWKYEKALRRLESVIGSTLGATGAIYALRRSLWHPLPADTLLDDVLAPMRAVLAGFRVVFQERARAFDRASESADVESRRKIRTLAGNVQILWLEPRLLVPFVNPVWWQYVSHKLGRLVVPYALLGLFAASLPLARQHPFYLAALVSQASFYLLAAWGAYLEFMRTAPSLRAGVTAPARWDAPHASLDERRI